MALSPLAKQFTNHVESLSAKCRLAADKASSASEADVSMQRLVREVIAASYVANVLARSQSSPRTRLPTLSRVAEVPGENSGSTDDVLKLPPLVVIPGTRARSGSTSSLSSTSTLDDEPPSPTPDRRSELGWELDSAIGCGDLPYIESLLEEARTLRLANNTEIARPLVALESYARRLQLLCRGSLDERNNKFDRV